jgi:hypothetical protein
MKLASPRYLELLESRLELLRTLIHTEVEWRRAFIALNLPDSHLRTADSELTCARIRTIDREIAALETKTHQVGTSTSAETDPVTDHKIRAALAQTAKLQTQLTQLNQTKRAILRRSKLTINALRNLFNSYAPTYGVPADSSRGTIYRGSV